MSFQFSFSIDESNEPSTSSFELDEDKDYIDATATASEVFPPVLENLSLLNYRNIVIGDDDITLKSIVDEKYQGEDILDLIPSEYEGGHVVWECSKDLVEYLFMTGYERLSSGKNVLELGSGQGLPGITALLLGFQNVFFTDFNNDVLQETTWKNIIINQPQELEWVHKVRCFSGDWLAVSQQFLLSDESIMKFDLILSAETLYSLECCRKVFKMIDRHLNEGGEALLATKRFYFGVGGGSLEINRLAHASGKIKYELVKSYEDGNSNIRDIIKLTKEIC